MTISLELLPRGPRRPDLLEDLVATPGSLAEIAERWGVAGGLPAELTDPTARPTTEIPHDAPPADEVSRALEEGTCVSLVVPAWVGLAGGGTGSSREVGPDAVRDLADLMIAATHSGVGFGVGLIPRVETAEQVWGMLGATVAAMTGGDVRGALRRSEPEQLARLGRSAREAVRDVVTFCLADGSGAARLRNDLEARWGH